MGVTLYVTNEYSIGEIGDLNIVNIDSDELKLCRNSIMQQNCRNPLINIENKNLKIMENFIRCKEKARICSSYIFI